MLTAINFMLALKRVNVDLPSTTDTWSVNLNTYTIFVGPSQTGKMPSMKLSVQNPFNKLNMKEHMEVIPTAQTLAKSVANADIDHAVMMVNSEIHELLKRMLENRRMLVVISQS